MNWDIIQGKWTQIKGSAKEEWGELTQDDIDVIDGQRDQLVGKLQERYGVAKDEAEKMVDDFATRVAA
ncbi:CsbD family protein [Marinovum sp. 2_MG-2023]|uniref:CsbD family protein n=1 Tax=Roseobacteraceae TaxID=2854170 RepID=UPI001FD41E2A|nr:MULTISPECIES: CsbD family protein [Roseobacteraceae]MCJ7870958.1 CsbD family protein [Phaeobacter sp. J2-8]MDO6729847.1 CsbD family protein [Marinovum sp. 2_MG-2023]MDO6779661.1 CsbD family protein [Marinovum sp. 1_MG-2023]